MLMKEPETVNGRVQLVISTLINARYCERVICIVMRVGDGSVCVVWGKGAKKASPAYRNVPHILVASLLIIYLSRGTA